MRSVRTTFRILDAVADNQPIGLSDLARRLELPKSTVQRSLATLADLGWIRSDGTDLARWLLGERVRTLSEKVDDLGPLRDAALPALGQLNANTLETVHLAAVEAGAMRLIERLDSKHALRFVQPIGARSPMHASSTGKSVLAYLPPAEITAYLDGDLLQITSNTITDAVALRTELEMVREQGFAISNEELSEGIISVGACIRPRGGRPIAAMSISGPTSRMSAQLLEEYGMKVATAAAEVSDRINL